jgi:plasmid stability protein
MPELSKSAREGYFKIRNLDDQMKERVRARARANGRSMSKEALVLLKAALEKTSQEEAIVSRVGSKSD